jgi:hypothetical protein
VKLRLVYQADFRKNEATNYTTACKEHQLQPTGTDVVMLVSKSWNQIIFVWRPEEITGPIRTCSVLSSRRLRLRGGTWNPIMLADYASNVGLVLQGLKLFEQTYREGRS